MCIRDRESVAYLSGKTLQDGGKVVVIEFSYTEKGGSVKKKLQQLGIQGMGTIFPITHPLFRSFHKELDQRRERLVLLTAEPVLPGVSQQDVYKRQGQGCSHPLQLRKSHRSSLRHGRRLLFPSLKRPSRSYAELGFCQRARNSVQHLSLIHI